MLVIQSLADKMFQIYKKSMESYEIMDHNKMNEFFFVRILGAHSKSIYRNRCFYFRGKKKSHKYRLNDHICIRWDSKMTNFYDSDLTGSQMCKIFDIFSKKFKQILYASIQVWLRNEPINARFMKIGRSQHVSGIAPNS